MLIRVASLKRLYVTLYGSDVRDMECIYEDACYFNFALLRLSLLSEEARILFSLYVSHSTYGSEAEVINTDNIYVDLNRCEKDWRFQLVHCGETSQEVEASGLLRRISSQSGKITHQICVPGSSTNFWEMINQFCKIELIDITALFLSLDFSVID